MSNAPNISSIEEYLTGALSPTKDVSSLAYKNLEDLANGNLAAFLLSLGEILSNESKVSEVRKLAAILIKNTLLYSTKFQLEWKTTLTKEQKDKIKLYVLSTLASSLKDIRTLAGTTVASLCKIDSPIKVTWPNLLQSLTQNAFNDNINLKLSAIETLGYVCEELTNKTIEGSDVDSIMNALIQNVNNESNDVNTIIQVLKALCSSIKLAEKNFANEKERDIILTSVFKIGQKYETNEEILYKIALLFVEMFSVPNYYDYLEKYVNNVFNFALGLAKTKRQSNEKLALLGLEIICCIGAEESTRLSQLTVTLRQTRSGLVLSDDHKVSKGYFNTFTDALQKYIINNVSVPENDEDENEWTVSKACLYILSLMMKTISQESILMFITNLQAQIDKSLINTEERCKCWLLLSSCLNSNFKKDIADVINNKLNYILKDIEETSDAKVRKCASFLLKRITKSLAKIFDNQKLPVVVNYLIRASKGKETFVVGNVCQTLQNLIKSFGDRETLKNTNQISPLFSTILIGLYSTSEIELLFSKEEGDKISLSRLMTIKTLIEYSSHDCQDKVYEVLVQYLKEIEFTHSKFNDLVARGVDGDLIYTFQEYYYTLLQALFKKYKKQINVTLCKNIWSLTEMIFTHRKSVFGEANLAMNALALNMQQNFSEIFPSYYPYIEYSIKRFNEQNLSKSGLIVLSNSLRILGEGIGDFASKILPVLVEVCTSNVVVRTEKTIAISCLGEFALVAWDKLFPGLKELMGLLMSAAKMGINVPIDADDDYVDFVKDLRYELIQTFICFEIGLGENYKEFIPYVPDIFSFFKLIVSDNKCLRPQTLKSMLSFICDMINSYGKEILQICNKEFAEQLFKSLSEFHLLEKDIEVEQNIELLKSLYK